MKATVYKSAPINILLIGNNPIEMGAIYERLKSFKSRVFVPSISFTLKDSLLKVEKEKPNCILVDDNFEQHNIQQLVAGIAKNKSSQEIPITILKSSNEEIMVSGIEDFLFKKDLSIESLSRSILNTIRLRKTRRFLYLTYKKRQRQLKKILLGQSIKVKPV